MKDGSRSGALRDLASLFLRLGSTAFGGPAAHLAMMEDEVVERRAWLSRTSFLDLLGATNLIPGPNSTEMAIHVGYRRAGWSGLLVAGACFILPASLATLLLAWAYVRYGSLPEVGSLLYGAKAAIVGVIVHALFRLGRTAIRTKTLAVLCLACVAGIALGVHELAVLFGAGTVLALQRAIRRGGRSSASLLAPLSPFRITAAATGAATTASLGLGSIFLVFLKIGSVLFGSGYVLFAFLRSDLVLRWHWLTEQQLLDAIAIGQITPGPVFASATFIGYLLAGLPGAAAATTGIFLPAFFFVAISGPFVPRLRSSPVAVAFLDGVVAASLALMAIMTWQFGRAAIVDLPSALIALASVLLLSRTSVNSVWLVLGGSIVGICLSAAR